MTAYIPPDDMHMINPFNLVLRLSLFFEILHIQFIFTKLVVNVSSFKTKVMLNNQIMCQMTLKLLIFMLF